MAFVSRSCTLAAVSTRGNATIRRCTIYTGCDNSFLGNHLRYFPRSSKTTPAPEPLSQKNRRPGYTRTKCREFFSTPLWGDRPRSRGAIALRQETGEAVRETARAPAIPGTKGLRERKAGVGLTEDSYQYILQHTREPQVLKLLREETSTMAGCQMQVSPDQAQHLAFLARIMGAKRCIEVGVYTGYSALAVALALPSDGVLVACDRSAATFEVAKKYFALAGVSHKVDIRLGLAQSTLESLLAAGEGDSYDFAFIDADKRSYRDYYELLLKLVRRGGVIAVDNVLWHGKVADTQVTDVKTQSLRDFNSFVLQDERVSVSMVAIGDGMLLCCKN